METPMETTVDMTVEAVLTDTASEDVEQTSEAMTDSEQTSEVSALDEETKAAESENGLVFTPVYNGEVKPIKAEDTARVTTLLQKGMKFEHMAGDLERLHRLASLRGVKSVTALLESLVSEGEAAKKNAYVQQYGKEAGERLWEAEQRLYSGFEKEQQASEEASREALHKRLASEFIELQEVHSSLNRFTDVPRQVVESALQNGISLLDAYNRHTLQEQQRVASATKQQAANQEAAVGSLASVGRETSDPVWEAFMRGVARAVR